MKLSKQHEELLEVHRDLKWHCSTEYEFIRDHRKRISEDVFKDYLKSKGYHLVGERCTMHNHKGNIFMRRAEKILTQSSYEEMMRQNQMNLKWFDQILA